MSAGQIQLPITGIVNPNLRKRRNWDTLLGADARALAWYVFDAPYVTVTGEAPPEISALTDRSTKARHLAQASDVRQPQYLTAQVGGKGAANFVTPGGPSSSADIIRLPFDLPIGENPFSGGMVINPGVPGGSSETLMGSLSTGVPRINLYKPSAANGLAGHVLFAIGALQVDLGAIANNAWHTLRWAFLPSTAAGGQARLAARVDGGAWITATTATLQLADNTPDVDGSGNPEVKGERLALGVSWTNDGTAANSANFKISDLYPAATDFYTGAAGEDLSGYLFEYWQGRYQLNVS